MAISSGLRNRLVGFAIVISTIVILLPLVISKDVLQRKDEQAIVINGQGAKYDADGNLQYASSPDVNRIFNISSGDNEIVRPQAEDLPSTNREQSDASLAEVNSDNSVEMLEFSGADFEEQDRSMGTPPPSNMGETLVMNTASESSSSKANAAPKEEVLTASTSKPSTPAAPVNTAKAEPPKPPIGSSSKPAASTAQGKFTIQVGVFSKKDNADNVIKKITQAGIHAYSVEIKNKDRILYRVYAGSANNRNDLQGTLKRIDELCKTKGRIVSL